MNAGMAEETVDTELDAKGKTIDPENYFAVRGQLWDSKTQDHTQEIPDGMGLKRFRDVTDALDRYEKVRHKDFSGEKTADINLELVHFRYGVPRIITSRILFP